MTQGNFFSKILQINEVYTRILLFLCLFLTHLFPSTLRIIYTSALIDQRFEERKEEYIHSLKILENYGYLPLTYIIESGPDTPLSFFPQYAPHVFYANTNNLSLRNKGVNEANAMIKGLAHYQFDEEDMILKMTGRYFFNSDHFLTLIKNHPDVDVFAKYDAYDQVFTGCYAIRAKYLKQLLREIDLGELESKLINIERATADFIQKIARENHAKVLRLDHLDVTANIFGFGTPELTQW